MDDFCKFYANDSQKLLFTDILEKRKRAIGKIKRHILSDSKFTEINENNFLKAVSAEHLSFIAKQIDLEYFDNNLFKTFDEKGCCMSFCMGNKCGSTAGFCSYRKGFNPEKRIMLNVEMMPKVFMKSFKNKDIELRAVDNLPCEDILTCFFITVCHELVHGVVFCNCKEFDKSDKGPGSWKGITRPGNGHNKTFMSILNNRFGHTKYTHNLKSGVTVESLEKEVFGQHNIKKGDVVVLRVRNSGGGSQEKEALILSAAKLQIKAQIVNNPSEVYKGKFYNSILRKVSYPKKTMTPILNAKPTKKITETDLTPKEELKPNPKQAPKPKTQPKEKKTIVQDRLIKNLKEGDIVTMNAKMPRGTDRETALVKILKLNRRKKKLNINIIILEGEFKDKRLVISEGSIVRNPENRLLPASPKIAKELAYKYDTLESLPFTRKSSDFDKDMASIDVKELAPKLVKEINTYPKVSLKEHIDPHEEFGPEIQSVIKKNNYFLLKLPKDNQIVLVNTSGFKYVRYGIKLNGTRGVISDNDFIDVQKEKKNTSKNVVPKKNETKPSTPKPTQPQQPKKRCPKGTRRDEKGNCVPKDQPKPKQPSPKLSPKKTFKLVRKEPKKNTTQTKKRCPNGTRRDEKGNCVPKDQKGKKNAPNPSPKKTFKLVRKEPSKTRTQLSKKVNKPDCTTRNPTPPCADGYVEKARPNGSICCYKDNSTSNLDASKLKKIHNQLYKFDFAYKPTHLKSLDSSIKFDKLTSEQKNYLKSVAHFNWNKPLPEDSTIKSENPLLYDYNEKISKIKDKFFIINVLNTEDRYGSTSNRVVLLIRNEGFNYVRYAIQLKDVPTSGFLKSGENLW